METQNRQEDKKVTDTEWLNLWGAYYDIPRFEGESDRKYRNRMTKLILNRPWCSER